MSSTPVVSWFTARRGAADGAGCGECDGCGERPKPPPKAGADACRLPEEPFTRADVRVLAPVPVVVAARRLRG